MKPLLYSPLAIRGLHWDGKQDILKSSAQTLGNRSDHDNSSDRCISDILWSQATLRLMRSSLWKQFWSQALLHQILKNREQQRVCKRAYVEAFQETYPDTISSQEGTVAIYQCYTLVLAWFLESKQQTWICCFVQVKDGKNVLMDIDGLAWSDKSIVYAESKTPPYSRACWKVLQECTNSQASLLIEKSIDQIKNWSDLIKFVFLSHWADVVYRLLYSSLYRLTYQRGSTELSQDF